MVEGMWEVDGIVGLGIYLELDFEARVAAVLGLFVWGGNGGRGGHGDVLGRFRGHFDVEEKKREGEF